jgi:hypothetical protein
VSRTPGPPLITLITDFFFFVELTFHKAAPIAVETAGSADHPSDLTGAFDGLAKGEEDTPAPVSATATVALIPSSLKGKKNW